MENRQFWLSVVEDRRDPLMLGRVRVRIIGLHNSNKLLLPTNDLPWAHVVQNTNSGAMNGIGFAPTGIVEGTWCLCTFTESDYQNPIVLGTMGGIPGSKTLISEPEVEEEIEVPEPPVYVTTGSGGILTDSSGAPVTAGEQPAPDKPYLGSLNKSQYDKLKEGIAKKESGGFADPYKAVEKKNGNYLGKYQMGAAKLVDLGYISRTAYEKYGTNAVQYADSWTGKDGIKDKDGFLGAPAIQEQCMDKVLANNTKTLAKKGGFDPATVDPGKLGGLLYTAHNQGEGNAVKFLQSEGKTQSKDGNGFSAAQAYNVGYEAVAGKKITSGELPSTETLSDPPAQNPDKAAQQDNRKYDVAKDPIVISRERKKRTEGIPGFVDPNGNYPRKSHLNEPDTNRLARGRKIDQTIVKVKEDELIKTIGIANSGTTWSQPPIPYNAEYPYNHVYESESGHIMEFDDTPEKERIHLYHKSGTFSEIDSSGTKVERIKGHSVIIVEKDQMIHVIGSGHVNLTGDLSIKVSGQCNIQVIGDAAINVGGSAYTTVAGSQSFSVGGDFKVSAGGNISLNAGGDVAADGSAVFWNSGKSTTADPIPGYSPTIDNIAPQTRKETADIRFENTEEQAKKSEPVEPEKEVEKNEEPAKEPKPVVSECDFILPLTMDTQLSANFKLKDLCKDGAFPLGKGQHGLTDVQIACNLKHLCLNVIEPLFAKYGKDGIKINSGFRPAGSGISKSKKISQHEVGQAVDIGFASIRGNMKAFYDKANEIKGSLDFDQLLLESTSSGSIWIHVSCKKEGNRPASDGSKVMTFRNHKSVGSGLRMLA